MMTNITPTLNSDLPDAELCRRNEWGPGTVLIGTEGQETTIITITALGEKAILAKGHGYLDGYIESVARLKFSDWKVLK